ncbi:MAG TPA: DUF5320 domain-containing protein [Desulfotomaculum sp.]|nr:DUF5320 domain-containing protein [Desulfotomaculum sp.]
MPGFNGTGPRGGGPMTGHGQGYCIVPLTPGNPQPGTAGAAQGVRRGRNACRRGPGGWGKKNCFRSKNP